MISLEQLVLDLLNQEKRENALEILAKRKRAFPKLALTLWYSFGTIAALLQEITSIYKKLSPPTLTQRESNRTCNAITLLHSVASHPETKVHFVNAQLLIYLYPFMKLENKEQPFQFLQLTSLGVVGSMVEVQDTKLIDILLGAEIVPLCLRIMEIGIELAKTIATFILERIIVDDLGLGYVCDTPDRFFVVNETLATMVQKQVVSPCLLKHIIRCYARLSDHAFACQALKHFLPIFPHLDDTFDESTRILFHRLMVNVHRRVQF